nr:MAG TPA: Protein of unknown function (DUF1492) [Caudoviricetes sp.]
MRAKEYLQQLRRLDTVIDQKIKELDDLKVKSTCIGGFDYSKERVQTSPSGDAPYAKTVHRMIDLNEKINRDIDDFVDRKHKIINEIQSLENTKHIQILFKKYVEYKSFEQISVEMNYTYQYIVLLHGYALKEFSQKYSIYFQ